MRALRKKEPVSVNTTAMRAQNPAAVAGRTRGYPAYLWYLFCAALLLFIVGPVLLFFGRLFEDGGSAFERMLALPRIGSTLGMTVGLAAGSTVIAAVLAITLAALIMKAPERLRGFLSTIPLIPLVMPPVAVIYGWIFLFSPEVGYGNAVLRTLPFFSDLESGPLNVYSSAGIILIAAIDLTGLIFAFVFPRLQEISGSVEASARVAGASAFRSFMTISLPLLRPAVVASTVIVFLTLLGQFTAPLLLGTRERIDVVSTVIFKIREEFPIDYPLTAALGLPLLIFGILAILVQRKLVGDQRRYMTDSSGRGYTQKGSIGATATVLAYAVIAVVLPVVAIVLVAFSRYWSGNLDAGFTTSHVTLILSDSRVLSSVINTLAASAAAVLIVIPVGFFSALALSGVLKVPTLVTKVLDFIFIAPLAVPRALLGIAIVFVFIRPPFNLYGTLALFVIGYIFIVLPFALRSQYSSLIGVHKSLFEASRVAGAGSLTMIRTIALPITRRGMAAAVALSFVVLSNDFAVSIMVRAPGNQVMGTLLYQYAEDGSMPAVAVMSLLMSIITVLILTLALRIGGKSALNGL